MAQLNSLPSETASNPFEEGSVWSDDVWRFPITTAGSPQSLFSMNWAIPLDDGGLLVDPTHADALKAWKQVLWTMLVSPPDGHPRKGSYCGKFGTALRFLVPWMISTGRNIGELDRSAFPDFLQALEAKAIEDIDEDQEFSWDEGGITDVTVSSYLTIFSLPYIVRQALDAAGLPSPSEDPLDGKHPMVVAREICRKVVRQTPEVPDPIFVATLNAAVDLLEAPWLEPLIKLCNDLPLKTAPEHDAQCVEFVRAHLNGIETVGSCAETVRSTIIKFRAACQIIIQASSAIRVSELCGVETKGYDADHGVPKCITITRTFDDEYEILSLNAKLFKHTSSSEPATWVLGMRPTGSAYLPPPAKAIDILHRLDSGWRRLAGIDALLIQFSTARSLPKEGKYIVPASSVKLRNQQRRWMTETGCAREDQRITTHMWRKTFARYLIRVSADLLPAISHHLKHLSIAMTEVGYCKPDPGMRELIEDARVEEAGSVIFGAITGRKRVEGPIAAEIRALSSELSHRLGNRPTETIARDIEEEVRERRIELYGNEVGWCVFRSESARCHLLAADPAPAFLRLAPAFGERRADVCQKCQNFGIGDEHIGFWRERRSSLHDRLSACGSNTPPSVKVCLERSLSRCNTVLSWMGEGNGNDQ